MIHLLFFCGVAQGKGNEKVGYKSPFTVRTYAESIADGGISGFAFLSAGFFIAMFTYDTAKAVSDYDGDYPNWNFLGKRMLIGWNLGYPLLAGWSVYNNSTKDDRFQKSWPSILGGIGVQAAMFWRAHARGADLSRASGLIYPTATSVFMIPFGAMIVTSFLRPEPVTIMGPTLKVASINNALGANLEFKGELLRIAF